MLSPMKLHNHFRSSASLEGRTALKFKGRACDPVTDPTAQCENLKAPCDALSADGVMPQIFNASRITVLCDGLPLTLVDGGACAALSSLQRSLRSACPDRQA